MFKTKRLILREWKDEDIPAFSAMNQDARVMEFFPYTLDLKQTEALVGRIRKHFKAYRFGPFAVELKETGEFIGFVGLFTPIFQAHFTPCVEIGWRLAAQFWGQGYATEAARMVLHLAFEEYGLKEVVSFTALANKRSMHVMEKLGMTYNPQDDFHHPNLAKDHWLARHVLYRITAEQMNKKDAILLEPYDPKWINLAQEELAMLKENLPFPWIVDMQHIGSTAIPNLPAKPIIDLAIGVTDLSFAKALIPLLEEQDYVFWVDNPDKTKLFFVKGMPPFGEKRTHHIHVLPITHYDWMVRPLFRDYLIAHPEGKQAYADLKEGLALQYQEDREAYTAAKTAFIQSINWEAMKSHFGFRPLTRSDFPLLLKWLEAQHVKAFWDSEIPWTLEKIEEKYASYVEGYKLEAGVRKPMFASLVMIDVHPIGYVQFYNAWDFEWNPPLDRAILPRSLAALDFYIGEPTFIRKGVGTVILEAFLKAHVDSLFSACMVRPERDNIPAIKLYEKLGFKAVKQGFSTGIFMLRKMEGRP